MKKSYIYTAILSCIAMVSGCANIEEFEEPAQKVSKTFYAEMEDSPLTKTVLGDKGEDGIRPVLWMPEDKIGVAPSTGGAFDMFVNKSAESSVMTEFEGQTSLAPSYFAVYPYDKDAVVADGSITFTLNTEQTYKAGSFDQGAFPMIARSSDSSSDGLMFYNLCGVLEVNLTGEEKITKISFSSDNKVSGKFSVNANYEQYPEMVADASSLTSTTLNCDEGVQLKPDSPTPFYLVLPPGIYETFTLTIKTSDGKRMFKQSRNPLNLKRSYITSAGALEYIESVSFDLSQHGTANCYVVPGIGTYCFNASIIGNGTHGIIPGASFHTEDPGITPASVEVLWATTGANEDTIPENLIGEVTLKDGYVHFVSTGAEGNALVAVKGEKGSILWSWHLWFTDSPKEHHYTNSLGDFHVLDRNLGATRADRGTGDEWKESYGAIYQWGRKDPFFQSTYTLYRSDDNSRGPFSISSSIQHPAELGVLNNGAINHPSWVDVKNADLWNSSTKTIYDPCPVGYKVPEMNIWRGFTIDGKDATYMEAINATEKHDHGFDFIYDGVNTTWYPAAPMTDWNGGYHDPNKAGRLWTTTPERSFKYEITPKITFDNTECWENYAISVRCVKDDGHVDLALPVVEMVGAKDATAESVSLTFNVVNAGASSVTESGIIYSTTPDVSTGNGQKVAATGTEYKVDLTGLTEGTKYYAVAYATNTYGTSYSTEIAFYTIYEGDGIDLSKDGTANSYIVPPVYSAYSFDCTVKGNSTEPVGEVASAEVIWETKNTSEAVSLGEIIPSVELQDGKVKFMLPFEPVHGNALIAIKDAAGKILWSWHVWVTDYDPETDYDMYASGAKMMDRNLGALNTTMGDTRSYGFYYQWGRKDPFMTFVSNDDNAYIKTYPENINIISESSELTDINTTIQNPVKIYKNTVNWLTDNTLWGSKKTMYDPCPDGWRIPDGGPGVWDGFEDSPQILSGGVQVLDPLSSPAAFYPTIKTLHESGVEDNLTLRTYLWSCTISDGTDPFVFVCSSYSNGSIQLGNRSNKMAQRLVRCMKEDSSDKVGNGDDYIVDDEYEW